MTLDEARTIVIHYNIPVGVDFFTLTKGQTEDLAKLATLYKYKRPKNSQGSKTRHFYKELMRHIRIGGLK